MRHPDPSQWDDTLGEIVAALSPPDWDVVLLQWERLSPPGCRFVGATSLIPMAREIYRTTFAGRHPWSRRMWALPVGRVVETDEIMPRSEILESEFFKKFLSTWNLQIAIGVILDRQGPERLGFIMPGPPGYPIDGLKRGIRLLAPHIQRAIRISRALGEANLRAEAAQSAMNTAPNAIATLTPDLLKMMTGNEKLLELVRIRLGENRRRCFRLHRPQGSAAPDRARRGRAAEQFGLFRAAGPDGFSDLAVLGARLTTQTADTLEGRIEGAGIILTIGIGGGAPLIAINRLAAWFGLTPAEARLAAELSGGRALEECAARRNVSMNAVRFLLKGIYRKTSVGSQAQLIAQITQSASALRLGGAPGA